LGYDRILQELVEVSLRNHAERLHVMLVDHVETVARLGLEVRIAEVDRIPVRSVSGISPVQSLGNVLRIGP